MKKKMFLTSAVAMGVVAPAVAAPTYTSDTFPSTGLMQEDYTYTNAATATNMDSVYEGTVNAVAEYDIVDYILSAGQYLPADSETPTACPAGSFCSGIGSVNYNENSAQGIETCPTGFGSSAAGATSANECYRQCSGNVTIEHATGVTGNDYYGSGVDTCEPTGCVNGWHLKLDVETATGNTKGVNSAYINGSGTFSEKDANFQPGNKGQTYYGLTDNNTWAVEYDSNKGMISGQARCSTVGGVYDWDYGTETLKQPITTHTTSELGAEGGKYCYCNVTGYKDASGTLQSLSSLWVFSGAYGGASNCADYCADNCIVSMRDTYSKNLAWRAAVFGAVQSGPAMCAATNYLVNAGQYLPADSETPTTCPAGSFCSGIGSVNYNENSAQGIETCPTGFGSSAAGASSANECYRQCSGNVTIEHATGVTGNDYYGSGVDTCEPTGCVNGWHLKSGMNGSAIATAIGETAGENSACIKGSGSFEEINYDGLGAKGKEYYSLTNKNTWAVDYGDKGFLYGQGRCSTQEGTNNDYSWTDPTIKDTLTDETGQTGAKYCYCNVTGYTPDGGTLQSLSSSWVSTYDFYDASKCASDCAQGCAFYMRGTYSWNLAFRTVMFNSVQPAPAMCEANTITINWSNADAEDISANNAGTATYGEDVRTPVKAETIKGKTFKGWKFSKPEQTPLP